jgi:hypothetical protein
MTDKKSYNGRVKPIMRNGRVVFHGPSLPPGYTVDWRGPKGTLVKQSQPRRRRGRRSGRGARRRQGQGPRGRETTSGRSSISAPAAVGAPNFVPYKHRDRAPVHKEWGEGVRIIGGARWGTVDIKSGEYSAFIPYILPEMPTGVKELYNHWDINICAPTTGRQVNFPIHPISIPRLFSEAAVWSRYIPRWVKLTYAPTVATNTTGGQFAALTRNLDQPFRQTSLSTPVAIAGSSIVNYKPSALGSFWQPLEIVQENWSGERTFLTSMPVVPDLNGSIDGGEYALMAEKAYCFLFNDIVASGFDSTATASNLGIWNIEYVFDFYCEIESLVNNGFNIFHPPEPADVPLMSAIRSLKALDVKDLKNISDFKDLKDLKMKTDSVQFDRLVKAKEVFDERHRTYSEVLKNPVETKLVSEDPPLLTIGKVRTSRTSDVMFEGSKSRSSSREKTSLRHLHECDDAEKGLCSICGQ